MADHVFDLHRCRLAREDFQPVAGSMAGEIDQYVDAVLPHCLGQFGIAAPDGRAPMIGHGAEALRRRILDRQFGIAEQLDLRCGHAPANRGSANKATAWVRKSGDT